MQLWCQLANYSSASFAIISYFRNVQFPRVEKMFLVLIAYHASNAVLLISPVSRGWSHFSISLFSLGVTRGEEAADHWSLTDIIIISEIIIRTRTCTKGVVSSVFTQLLVSAADILTPQCYLRLKIYLRSGKIEGTCSQSYFQSQYITCIFFTVKNSLVLIQLSGWLP